VQSMPSVIRSALENKKGTYYENHNPEWLA
jgi:hypothetical protein